VLDDGGEQKIREQYRQRQYAAADKDIEIVLSLERPDLFMHMLDSLSHRKVV